MAQTTIAEDMLTTVVSHSRSSSNSNRRATTAKKTTETSGDANSNDARNVGKHPGAEGTAATAEENLQELINYMDTIAKCRHLKKH